MLFNSISFAIFFPIVFVLYWFFCSKNYKYQNLLLLVASYYFYANWDWRFMFLLIFSTVLDYVSGLKIENAESQHWRKFWLWLSIGINLGFLGFFKYYNFFIESFATFFQSIGLSVNIWTLKIILPVGISFYTFHGLSYVLDIYNRKIKAEHNFVDYSVFVSFFPLLVAGPIERATHLLPQIQKARTFNYTKAVDGLRQILWGLFKKIVIADNCAEYANMIFNDSAHQSGSNLVMGALFFTVQIYCDFSGYSDIALGTARLLGIELLKNFSFPYFSRDIAEFWRRWHISLSTWFRDYLYIPLGGSKGGTWMKIRNTFVIFIVSGFWHGANWTFIVWGFLNALYFLPLMLTNKNRNNLQVVAMGKLIPSLKDAFKILITFTLTAFAWIFFRAEDLTHAFSFIKGIFNKSTLSFPTVFPVAIIGLSLFFFVVEWFGREDNFAIEKLFFKSKRIMRYIFYFILIILIYIFAGKEQEFIYFQF
ncbi:MBOAT family O-acyltransferase [Chryseobacterium sp. R2A-55]|uniref:MBOAT family O-acyltransferase n=1 Tax=Chryseobacterium sp. R2A-55 TaxID=2744445 RepID=UPI001F18611D|nr:MBOAT family O-acyltransferase [Chryseobacterium sp. R2A-55]